MRSFFVRSVGAVAVLGSLLFATGASANTITVTSVADPTGTSGTCTLRDAITAANTDTLTNNCAAGSSGSSDNINFALPGSPPHTIQLASQLPAIGNDLTITGPGSELLTIRGELGTGNYYVIPIVDDGSFPFPTVTLTGMTVTNGAGGILAGGGTLSLTLNDVTVSGNSVESTSATQSVASGAGIENTAGANVTINNSTITGNTATATTTGPGFPVDSVFSLASGAAIQMTQSGHLSISRSTISGNHANANGNQTASASAAIFDEDAITISRSTINGNTATATTTGADAISNANGGGIEQLGAGGVNFNVDASTIAGNTAATVTGDASGIGFPVGGGVFLNQTFGGSLSGSVVGSTISGNTVSATGPGSGFPTGADVELSSNAGSTFTSVNTIIANGVGAANCHQGSDGTFASSGYNIDTGTSCLGTPTTGDQTGVTTLNLGPLQENGGATFTMAPGINSPAVDKGTAAGDSIDQRGLPRTFDMGHTTTGFDGTDIGAFEQTILKSPDVPAEIQFGTQRWGTASGDQEVSVLNRTGSPITPGTIAFTGNNPSDFQLNSDTCSNTLLANGFGCTVNAVFHPVSAGGALSASLDIPTDVSPLQSISVNGTSNEYLGMAPTPKDFGSTQVGTPTGTTQFTVTNAGPATSGSMTVALTGANPSEFGITQDNCTGQTLTFPGSCTVSVRFAPTSAGSKTASLGVTEAPGGTQTSALTGTATSPPPPPTTTTTPVPGPTGQRAAALKKCKKKKSAQARKKCKKKANKLPV